MKECEEISATRCELPPSRLRSGWGILSRRGETPQKHPYRVWQKKEHANILDAPPHVVFAGPGGIDSPFLDRLAGVPDGIGIKEDRCKQLPDFKNFRPRSELHRSSPLTTKST
ncbi:MAG: hypothetical protein KDA66_00100 [Planctomycetaceae bacterium]|nr:hypothetical protein [Planctomycetaceae bacterium]